MRQLESILAHQKDLEALCRLKARPPVMRDLIPSVIPDGTLYTVYRYVNKCAPPRGQLPQEITVFLATPKKRLHASALLCIWERFESLSNSIADRYVRTYEMYVGASAGAPIYDFNRAWFIIRQYTQRRVALRTCPKCGQRYVYNREDVSDIRKCHGCAIYTSNGNPIEEPTPPAELHRNQA